MLKTCFRLLGARPTKALSSPLGLFRFSLSGRTVLHAERAAPERMHTRHTAYPLWLASRSEVASVTGGALLQSGMVEHHHQVSPSSSKSCDLWTEHQGNPMFDVSLMAYQCSDAHFQTLHGASISLPMVPPHRFTTPFVDMLIGERHGSQADAHPTVLGVDGECPDATNPLGPLLCPCSTSATVIMLSLVMCTRMHVMVSERESSLR